MIRGLVPKERLLEWSVDEGWEPLCKFLGKPVPNEPFPRVNAATGGWMEREKQSQDRWIKGAVTNIFLLTALAVGGAAAYWKFG